MRDYFTLLAARLGGAPDRVRPRTPARFEPARRGDPDFGAALAPSPSLVVLEEPHDVPAAASRPVERQPPPRRQVVHRPEEPPPADESEPSAPRHPALPRRRAASAEHPPRGVPREDERVAARSRDERNDAPRTPPPSPRRSDADRRTVAPPVGEPPARAERATAATGRLPSPEGARPIVMRLHDRHEASERPPAPPLPPSIQITIGRIEVEAIAPRTTPPPTPRRADAPTLTLDAYLASRNGQAP